MGRPVNRASSHRWKRHDGYVSRVAAQKARGQAQHCGGGCAGGCGGGKEAQAAQGAQTAQKAQ